MEKEKNIVSSYDSTYAKRHANRNKNKVQLLLDMTDVCDSVLDIGCNEGYVSSAMLSEGKAHYVHAVELDRSVVSKKLVSDNRFKLFEGPVSEFEFKQKYCGVIYNAVHHHVFALEGKEAAFEVFRKIVRNCDKFIFFETGQLSEGGHRYWYQSIRDYYSDDQSHFGALFHAIGCRLKGIKLVDNLPIQGVYRQLIKIELHPLSSEFDLPEEGPSVYGTYWQSDSSWKILKHYNRTIGSKGQRLIENGENVNTKQPQNIYQGTNFFELISEDGQIKAFSKKRSDESYKDLREFNIVKQVDHHRALQPIGVTAQHGLVFPFRSYLKFDELDITLLDNERKIKFFSEIIEFYAYARSKIIDLGLLALDSYRMRDKLLLIDLIDIHPGNILVEFKDGDVVDWIVIDFECYSNSNRPRNEQHLVNIASQLGLNITKAEETYARYRNIRSAPILWNLFAKNEKSPISVIIDIDEKSGNVVLDKPPNIIGYIINNCPLISKKNFTTEELLIHQARNCGKSKFRKLLKSMPILWRLAK